METNRHDIKVETNRHDIKVTNRHDIKVETNRHDIKVTMKGPVQDFHNLLTAPVLCIVSTLKWPGHNCVQITCNTSTDRALTTRIMPWTTWYQGTAQLLSLTKFKSHLFSFILLAETKLIKEGGKPEYPEKTPDDDVYYKLPCIQ